MADYNAQMTDVLGELLHPTLKSRGGAGLRDMVADKLARGKVFANVDWVWCYKNNLTDARVALDCAVTLEKIGAPAACVAPFRQRASEEVVFVRAYHRVALVKAKAAARKSQSKSKAKLQSPKP